MKNYVFAATVVLALFAWTMNVYAGGPEFGTNQSGILEYDAYEVIYTIGDKEVKKRDGDIMLMVNGDLLPAFATIISNRALVPIRSVSDKMNYAVAWNPKSKNTTLTNNATTVKLTVNSKTAYVNGIAKALDVPATIIDGQTYMPLRFVGETFGATVGFYQDEFEGRGFPSIVWIDEPFTGTPIQLEKAFNGAMAGALINKTWGSEDFEFAGGFSKYYIFSPTLAGHRPSILVDKYSGAVYENYMGIACSWKFDI